MILQTHDFNGAERLIARRFRAEWNDLERVLKGAPLHLKPSDQAGKQGRPGFDPVGMNEYIKIRLAKRGWSRLQIPAELHFLGTDVDYGKRGMIVEAQFSNYPFLLNNLVRSEIFHREKVVLGGKATEVAVIITKARMLPSANSTLYIEQAVRQLSSLDKFGVFHIPTRCVGMFIPEQGHIAAVWSEYAATRYSRVVKTRVRRKFTIVPGRGETGRCRLLAAED